MAEEKEFRDAYIIVLDAVREKVKNGTASPAEMRDYDWLGTANDASLSQTVDKMIRAIKADEVRSDWMRNNPLLGRAARKVGLTTSPELRAFFGK